MMGRSFVRRCDPEQHRFAKRHGKEIDSHGKLCRHRADQPRAAGSIRIANAIEDLRREPGRDGDRRESHRSEQCPSLMRPAVHVRLHRRLDKGRRHVAGWVRHGVEIECRHALHNGLLYGGPVGIPISHVQRRGLVGVLQD